MKIQFEAVSALKCKKQDVIAALGIYCKNVDQGSITDTNQIKDYIWNAKPHCSESRQMFFYLLYGEDKTVEGFAEFAYLPTNQVLVIDYLCTSKKSNMQFYTFYHLAMQEINEELKKHQHFIRYIITELSLRKKSGTLIDQDSNYFRHLLSNENFCLLKYPYYQPPLLPDTCAEEFNLVIKPLYTDSLNSFMLTSEMYLNIVNELYLSHYLEWYKNYSDVQKTKEVLNGLLNRIRANIPNNMQSESITMIQCQLFDEGQCPKFTAENYTASRSKKKTRKKVISIGLWLSFSVITFIACIIPELSKCITNLCSFLTIVTGCATIITIKQA